MKDDIELWRAYRRTRDSKLRDRLIEHHLVLVKYVAARVGGRLPRHLRMDDLFSAGLMGFLGAVEDYDPEVGVTFSAYATPRIRGAIFDELRRLDVVPRNVRRRIREAERAIETVTARLDRQPTEEEIAGEMGVEVEAYRQLLGAGVTMMSLDAVSGRGDEAGEALDLPDMVTPEPFAELASQERRALLGRLIDRLPKRERTVLALYYVEELTMREVGEVLGVTESRVSQLHSSAILQLRSALRRQRIREGDLVEVGTAGSRQRGRRS